MKNPIYVLIRARDDVIKLLSDGRSLNRREIKDKLLRDDYWKRNFRPDAVYAIACEIVRVYQADFYADPSTHRVLLTRERLQAERNKRRKRIPIGSRYSGGTTAGAQIAAAMEAREAGQ